MKLPNDLVHSISKQFLEYIRYVLETSCFSYMTLIISFKKIVPRNMDMFCIR